MGFPTLGRAEGGAAAGAMMAAAVVTGGGPVGVGETERGETLRVSPLEHCIIYLWGCYCFCSLCSFP
jgi:hypothetical protein